MKTIGYIPSSEEEHEELYALAEEAVKLGHKQYRATHKNTGMPDRKIQQIKRQLRNQARIFDVFALRMAVEELEQKRTPKFLQDYAKNLLKYVQQV